MENSTPEVHGDVRDSGKKIKLAAIYNLWDAEELLIGSMRSIKDGVDLFIIMWQDVSNFGEQRNPLKNLPIEKMDAEFKILWIKYDPVCSGMIDEKIKRGLGLNVAREHGCTHFLMIDCDEYYLPGHFKMAKDLYLSMDIDGSVLELFTFFGNATLRQENKDNYFVPFIHTLKPDTVNNLGQYPFFVDPTRKINATNVKLLPFFMQHYSWVRHNIELKARNSSAKRNIERAGLLRDYYKAEEGAIVNGGNRLVKVEDVFGITEMIDKFDTV